ncbi:MAG: hypothetical protein ABNH38_17730 [Tateyamaria sp.]|uniref:hypothetical protein n=1 Tax=Tateyamaria sp. TaxID=1929288 RepID=UPI0032DC4F7B
MSEYHKRGGAAVAALNRMDAWEAALVLNLRLWSEGPAGQEHVRGEFDRALNQTHAKRAWEDFDSLLRRIIDLAHRPMVRHEVGCNCVGADECVFAHLVGTASAGHLNDAALIATLLVGPAHAEHIAILAGEVGQCARRIHKHHTAFPTEKPHRAVRLH